MSWHGVNVELNFREATALEGHSREAIHLAAEVIRGRDGIQPRGTGDADLRIHRRRDRATLANMARNLDSDMSESGGAA